jgi:hypothetical protein
MQFKNRDPAGVELSESNWKGPSCNDELKNEKMRAYTMSMRCAKWRRILRRISVTQAAKTWKSHVNATIRCVHSRCGVLWVAMRLAWPANNERAGAPSSIRIRRASDKQSNLESEYERENRKNESAGR